MEKSPFNDELCNPAHYSQYYKAARPYHYYNAMFSSVGGSRMKAPSKHYIAIEKEHPHMQSTGGYEDSRRCGKGIPQIMISADVIKEAFIPSSP
jgi:hypothetical protein